MVLNLIWAGLAALQDYIALHVLTCLIPAFLLAGAMVAFINKEAIMARLGRLRPSRPASPRPPAPASSWRRVRAP